MKVTFVDRIPRNDAGKVRRGYFVEGLGGAQFAVAGAIVWVTTTRGVSSSAGSIEVARSRVFRVGTPHQALRAMPTDPFCTGR